MIDNKIQKSFPPSLSLAGYVFLVFGLLVMFGSLILGIILFLIGALICFTYDGIQIDDINKRYRNYIRFYGIRKGKWNPLDDYIYITILSKRLVSKVNLAGISATSSDDKYFDICLLNNTHRIKLIIKRLTDLEQAKIEANELAKTLGVEFTNYNPVVSEKTKEKRLRK